MDKLVDDGAVHGVKTLLENTDLLFNETNDAEFGCHLSFRRSFEYYILSIVMSRRYQHYRRHCVESPNGFCKNYEREKKEEEIDNKLA